MIYILFYDITSDKLRTKIAKLLISMGYERLQFSVFTGLDNPVINKYLWPAITKILKSEPTARFFVLPIKKDYFCEMQGLGVEYLDLEYLAGNKRSLIL
jgi:CRISPR-associated endonuclease Cas2